jgi:para-nitrobenzyl esterase
MHVFTTTHGRVRGHRTAGGPVRVLGIPYAAPPFGDLRFREPRPAAPWRGVRDGGRFGPVAPQSARLPGAPGWAPGDEDVLTLNVWTSRPGAGSLPVLVWIHGGAYTFGSPAQPDFDGTELARAGLVVVTVAYRLGFEGFGHVPGGRSPANRGLLDQIAALRWVRENIASFGGDPGRVTVAGQSSGATSVACLMVMDRARGLFHRALAHSPVHSAHSPALAARTTAEVAAAAGVGTTAAALAAAPPQALLAAADRVADAYRLDPAAGPRHYDPVLYGPVVDGDTLPAEPLDALAAGAARDVELLVCHTAEEYWLLDAVGACAEVATPERFSAFQRDFALPDDLVEGYRRLFPGAGVAGLYLAILGDRSFGEYSRRLAGHHARAGGRTFRALFARRRPGSAGPVRAWHNADIPFAFGTLGDPRLAFLIGGPPNDADHDLSRRLRASWAGFAATGDPGWPPFTGTGPVHLWTTADTEPRTPPPDTRALWSGTGYAPLAPPPGVPGGPVRRGTGRRTPGSRRP